MTEEQKQQVAVFRFGVIAEFVGAIRLDHGEREALLRQKCARRWQIPFSTKTRIGRGTILRWVRRYLEQGGRLDALYPQGRADRGKVRALDEETSLSLAELRRQLPRTPVPELIRLMHERRLASAGTHLSQTTVYRFLHQQGLMAKEAPAPVDRRKFEAELPNDLWQCDVMHGPHLSCDGRRRKSYLIAFIDDHSRLIVHGRFTFSEALAPFMEAFSQALLGRGLPRKLYVDNGSAFRSRQLEYTAASLGIALIHAKPYQPQGKGKIERFFRTVQSQFLPGFAGDTLEAINAAFDHWLDHYHQRPHSSTGQSPFKRFTAQMQCLRSAPANLTDYFRKTVRRRVNKDRSVVIDKRLFEAPVELIGKRVELLYHEQSPELVEIRCSERSWGCLRQIDLHVNSRVKRDRNGQIELVGQGACESGRLWEGA